MAAQQVQFAETIRAMKLALRRRRNTSPPTSDDSDDLYVHTNRGNKLKPSARYVREERLDTTGGQAYKRKISHAGYDRYIVAKKPKLYDDDGDVVDQTDIASDADEDDRTYGETVRQDPFGEVQLEDLLRPLTSAAELPEHPSLSVAYTSRALTQMAEQAAEMVRRERAGLWKAKRLLERFRGDGGWMSCEQFETSQDGLLLQREGEVETFSGVPSMIMDDMPLTHTENGTNLEDGNGQRMPPTIEGAGSHLEPVAGIDVQDHVRDVQMHGMELAMPAGVLDSSGNEPTTNGNSLGTRPKQEGEAMHHAPYSTIADLQRDDADESASNSASGTNAPSHAMTTRARARSPQLPHSPSPSPSDSASVPSIHPWFLIPGNSLADRDLGLPLIEAEDTRKLLLLYVQKQENIVRQLSTLYDGLQRTDRLRREVYRACKAEAYVVPDGKGGVQTEMSDGEDWYDVVDWGLRDGTLEKGKDEVEDLAEEEGRRVGGRRRRVVGR